MRHQRSGRHLAPLLFGMALATLFCGPAEAAGAPEEYRNGKACFECHEQSHFVWGGKHGVKTDARTPIAHEGCATCHGDPTEHMTNPDRVPMPQSLSKMTAADKNKICATCHQGGNHMLWQGSTHERNDVSCISCHKMHTPRDQVLVAETQAGVCFACHKDVRADLFRPSVHPLRTGRMACTACHQPHGSAAPHQLVRDSVNETCYTCHAEKRGPFLWEHPPAREDCGECHKPHGSVIAPLLKARSPYLCQQCHSAPFHPSTAYSGNNLPPNVAADKMLGQQCQNCHPKVHGTNHPSGPRLTR